MITYKQITKASDIASLSDYYVLDVRTTGPNPSLNAISSVSMLQIEDDPGTDRPYIFGPAFQRSAADSALFGSGSGFDGV